MLQLLAALIVAAFGAGFAGGFAVEHHRANVHELNSKIAHLERVNGLYQAAAGVAAELDAQSEDARRHNEDVVRDILSGLRDKAAKHDASAAQAPIAFLSPITAVVAPEAGTSTGLAVVPSNDGVSVPKPKDSRVRKFVGRVKGAVTKHAKPPVQSPWSASVCVDADSMRKLRDLR